jgi:putative ABC transport system ATP-binding protein
MTQPLLSAHNLVKSYGTTQALDGVSLAIGAGESVAIMGASGSGKTTLLHTLAGIITPDGGQVVFQGPASPVEVSALAETERSRLRRESFGFVFQQGLLIPELTAVENVAVPLMLSGYPRREAEARAQHWLQALGLAGMETRRPGELSGGQAQRVAIARAQVTGATVVFADEPTGALDSNTSVDVLNALLGSTVSQGHTLVMVTHDEGVAARCSRVIRVRDGRIVSDSASASAPAPASVPGNPGGHANAGVQAGHPGAPQSQQYTQQTQQTPQFSQNPYNPQGQQAPSGAQKEVRPMFYGDGWGVASAATLPADDMPASQIQVPANVPRGYPLQPGASGYPQQAAPYGHPQQPQGRPHHNGGQHR